MKSIGSQIKNFVVIYSVEKETGCGSVWLERVVRDDEAAGSNPVIPINKEIVLEKYLSQERMKNRWCGSTFLPIYHIYICNILIY